MGDARAGVGDNGSRSETRGTRHDTRNRTQEVKVEVELEELLSWRELEMVITVLHFVRPSKENDL